MKQRMDKK